MNHADRRCCAEPVAVERRTPITFLIIRVTLAQRQKLASIASLNGLNQSDFVRQAIDNAALDCTDDPVFGA